MNLDFIYWDHSYDLILLLNLIIVTLLFTAVRFFTGVISHTNATHELFTKDNPAFGLSVAGVFFGVTIVLTGTIYGNPEETVFASAFSVLTYGVIGIVLMGVTRFIFDKIALPEVHLREEILKGNMAVAIADTGNVIAGALVIRAVMVWITDNTIDAIISLLVAYAASQFILTAATWFRLRMFEHKYKGRSTQEELRNGNIALALAFAGRKIGTALAITVASHLVVYEEYDVKSILLPWMGLSVFIIIVLKGVSFVAERLILVGVDRKSEVLDQRNIAVGALQAVIYISLAILLAEL
jgi:uncharacterized membrane protein YjfL (UPF0719 family)